MSEWVLAESLYGCRFVTEFRKSMVPHPPPPKLCPLFRGFTIAYTFSCPFHFYRMVNASVSMYTFSSLTEV